MTVFSRNLRYDLVHVITSKPSVPNERTWWWHIHRFPWRKLGFQSHFCHQLFRPPTPHPLTEESDLEDFYFSVSFPPLNVAPLLNNSSELASTGHLGGHLCPSLGCSSGKGRDQIWLHFKLSAEPSHTTPCSLIAVHQMGTWLTPSSFYYTLTSKLASLYTLLSLCKKTSYSDLDQSLCCAAICSGCTPLLHGRGGAGDCLRTRAKRWPEALRSICNDSDSSNICLPLCGL